MASPFLVGERNGDLIGDLKVTPLDGLDWLMRR